MCTSRFLLEELVVSRYQLSKKVSLNDTKLAMNATRLTVLPGTHQLQLVWIDAKVVGEQLLRQHVMQSSIEH